MCVCVSFTPISSLVTASFLLPPNAVPNSWPDTQGHLQRTEPAGTVISVPTLWDRHKISSARSRLLRLKDPFLGTWGLNHNGIGDVFPGTRDVARGGPLEGGDAVMLAWGPHFCEWLRGWGIRRAYSRTQEEKKISFQDSPGWELALG